MTYMITSQCIQCDLCASSCPTKAITQNNHRYQIHSEACNDCVGYYAVPQCWAICPTNQGCIPAQDTVSKSLNPIGSNDYWEIWFETYNHLVDRLRVSQPSYYWQRWFDLYSQALVKQLHPPTSVGANA